MIIKSQTNENKDKKIKLILVGSPWFSAQVFENIINNHKFEVIAIITQPNKKKNRGYKLYPTDVASLALKYSINLFKPEKIINIYSKLKNLEYDYFLTFAYGQRIPNEILELKLCINIHTSLLPKYRGAAPIHNAILNQESQIGVSIMKMVEKMDAGDVYFQSSVDIDETITTSQALNLLLKLINENIENWIKSLENTKPIKQTNNYTLAPKIKKEDLKLNLNMDWQMAFRKIKAYSEWPCAYIEINNKRIKIFNATKEYKSNYIALNFRNGTIYAFDYQFESKKRVILN